MSKMSQFGCQASDVNVRMSTFRCQRADVNVQMSTCRCQRADSSGSLLLRKIVVAGESGIFGHTSSAENGECGRIRNFRERFICRKW